MSIRSPSFCSVMRRFSTGKLSGSLTTMVTDAKLSTLRPVETHLLCGIQREMEAGTLPKFVARLMVELYLNYRNAVNRFYWALAVLFL
ncbi:glycerol-3-phosphate O-acyltransferase [Tanacetum coccineum]